MVQKLNQKIGLLLLQNQPHWIHLEIPRNSNFPNIFPTYQMQSRPLITINNFKHPNQQMKNSQGTHDMLPALSLEECLKNSCESISLDRGMKKSSFQLFNILKDSDQLIKREVRNSIEFLSSEMGYFDRSMGQFNRTPGHLYNEDDRVKIEQQTGNPAIEIGQVISDDEEDSYAPKRHGIKIQEEPKIMNPQDLKAFLPENLTQYIIEHEIPLEYLSGLMFMKDQKQVKTARRLRVERYLEKRQNKTWNRKICYNCRQKVAEERLRIKGKFIKKKRAMEILGKTGHMPTAELKRRLEKELQGKSANEIERIIKLEE